MEANLINNFKVEMLILKFIPFLLALLLFIAILLLFFGIYISSLGLIGGVSLIVLIFFYISSFIFKFCKYHRMPLHYLLITQLLCVFDTFVGIPISLFSFLLIHIALFICLIILIIYFKYGNTKKFNCKRS